MLGTRIIPVLLLKNGGLAKTVKFSKPVYVGDPINAVKIFNEKEADELVFLDISASPEKRGPKFGEIAKIAGECFMPFCYGGGIRSVEQMKEIFSLGAEKIAINTAARESPKIIGEAARIFGSQSVIVSIDAKKDIFGRYFLRKIQCSKINCGPVEFARQAQSAGAGEIMLNSVDRDGTMAGYDLELIEQVSRAVTIPVIACGGAGGLGDLKAAVGAGAAAAAAGSLFVFYGKNRAVLINYPLREELESLFNS